MNLILFAITFAIIFAQQGKYNTPKWLQNVLLEKGL